MKYFKLIVLLLTISQSLLGQTRWEASSQRQGIQVEQWTVHDVVYTLKKMPTNPFDKNVTATTIHGADTLQIPLFYNGGKEWILRFSGKEPGTYGYTLSGDLPELRGRKGSFEVTKNTKADRHGGVVVKKEDPKHFYYEDGTPYFNLAFECDWLFALDHGQKKLSKTDQLLSTVAQNGFKQVVMNVYSYDVSWKKDSLLAQHPEHEYGGREDIFPFLGSNKNPDFSALNVAFFQHLDRTMASLHDKELVSHLMIYVWNKMVNWPDMDTHADNLYYDYVIKRYQAYPNIMWDVSKEALYYGRATAEYISERIQRARKLDAYNRLISVHSYSFCSKHPDEVDFISSQDWSHPLYQKMLDAGKRFPNKPIFNIEHGGYEASPYEVFTGDYTDAEVCLRRNYMCLFAGSYTTYYWQGASWNAIIHNPFEQPASFPKPKFEYFAHMSALFKRYPFANFQANLGKNSSGYNLTDPKNGITMMYMPKENHSVMLLFLDLKEAPGHTMQWFNTLTGAFTPEEPFVRAKAEISPWRGQADTILIVKYGPS
ncbi:uncharacterized protein DUF5060 [Dyadobacter jejuensis]|uniref:Uncharacterized protein DUF5060 n=1 Tax=Dyadobacter jejuensis TaxID=1082580 RepID=A0A316AKJ9_9BACT|nr:DUF4038 domain-containing protein [Dyadobacter jejuensis]PWJ58022.1 uncharacterized protein DUF5060 [Dyadobacter jejuensis]